MSAALLAVDGLVAGYGDSVVLDGVSLELAPSASLAVLGRNGAGKTTLITTLMGLTRVHRGTIRFGGEAVTEQPRRQQEDRRDRELDRAPHGDDRRVLVHPRSSARSRSRSSARSRGGSRTG